MMRLLILGAFVTACTKEAEDTSRTQQPTAMASVSEATETTVGRERIDVLGEKVARLHHQVDVDLNRLASARQACELAERTLATDVLALDQAIEDFENADLE